MVSNQSLCTAQMGADSGILPFHAELQTLVLAGLGLPGGLGYGFLGLLWLRITDISPAPPMSSNVTYHNMSSAGVRYVLSSCAHERQVV